MNTVQLLKEEIKSIEHEIIKTEKKLLQVAPDNIKALYLKIDCLCCKQNMLQEKLISIAPKIFISKLSV